MLIRAATHDDVATVGALWRQRDVAWLGRGEITDEELAHDWRAPDFDLGTDSWLAVDAGAVIGYAEVWPDGPSQLFGEVVVRPDRAGSALEEELFARVEERAARIADGASLVLRFRAPSAAPHRGQTLRGRGYRPVRTFWRMRLDPEQPAPTPAWPTGIRHASLRPREDAAAVHRLLSDAFSDHFGMTAPEPFEHWRRDALEHPDLDPDCWVLAFERNALLGVLVGYPEPDKGWVKRLGVAASARGRGIGLALLAEGISRFRARGLRAVELAVDTANTTGAVRLYERAGMRVIFHTDLYERSVGSPT